MNGTRELAGDWIVDLHIDYRDRRIVHESIIVKDEPTAFSTIRETLGRIAWENIVRVHGVPHEGIPDSRMLSEMRCTLYVGPRAFR